MSARYRNWKIRLMADRDYGEGWFAGLTFGLQVAIGLLLLTTILRFVL